MPDAIRLEDRGALEISGEDAGKFLHGLVTNDILSLTPGEARFAALLTPQGKILFDFLIFKMEDGRYLIDCPRARASELEKRLNLYRLRAMVSIVNRSEDLESIALLDAREPTRADAAALARDPRASALGWRAIVNKGSVEARGDDSAYVARRVRACVPKGGVDFAYGDAFPHEANMDLLNGLDFTKGCYVGQEVVSRMKHRGTVRKRVVRYRAEGSAPASGEVIRAGELEIGVTGSWAGADGLAMIRLDRLGDALATGSTPRAAGVALAFESVDGDLR